MKKRLSEIAELERELARYIYLAQNQEAYMRVIEARHRHVKELAKQLKPTGVKMDFAGELTDTYFKPHIDELIDMIIT
jgi:hypothetical protein